MTQSSAISVHQTMRITTCMNFAHFCGPRTYSVKRSDVTRWKQGYVTPFPHTSFCETQWRQRRKTKQADNISDKRSPKKTQNSCITFIQRRPNVFDVGPTLYKCYANVLLAGVHHGSVFVRAWWMDHMLTQHGYDVMETAHLNIWSRQKYNNVFFIQRHFVSLGFQS